MKPDSRAEQENNGGVPRHAVVDPLQASYRDSISESPRVLEAVKAQRIALLVIDLQRLDATRDDGLFRNLDDYGIPAEAQDYYFYQLRNVVIPNVQRLQRAFRARNLEIIHTRIQSLTRDGRDASPGHRRLGLHAPPGSTEAEFLPEVAPVGDEIVVNKTASGCFGSTNLNYVLRNLGIDGLVVVGVYTNECVSTTIREGSDLGYFMTLATDACAAVTPELQRFTIGTLRDRYARMRGTDALIDELDTTIPCG